MRVIGHGLLQIASILATIWILLLYLSVSSRDAGGPLFGLGAYFAGAWLCMLLHETGHAVAAWACGWRVIVFAVRPFAIQLHSRELAWVSRGKAGGKGGWINMVPRTARVGSSRRFALIIAAGPTISTLCATAAFAMSATVLRAHDTNAFRWTSFAFAVGLQNAQIAILAILPSSRKDLQTDGQQLWSLRRQAADWYALRTILWQSTLLKCKVRLRDLPRWMVDAAPPASLPAEDFARYRATMEIGIALDTEPVDVSAVRCWIDAFRAQFGGSEWLDSCDAYLTAMWEGNAMGAREKLWNGPFTTELRPMLLASRAAVAARAGGATEAIAHLAEMRRAVTELGALFEDVTFRDIGRQIEAILPR